MSTQSKTVRLGLVQMAMSEDAEQNRTRAAELIAEAAKAGAQVVCLPELFTTPYFPIIRNAPIEAEPIPGPTSEMLAKAAKENNVIVVGGSYYEKDGEKNFNTALIYSEQGELLGTYRKVHIPHDECFFEQDYFTPGDLGYLVCPTSVGNIGVLICYDQWFPEAARVNALKGADIVFYPTAIGNVSHIEQSEGPWQDAWENVQRGHAIANGMVVAAVNRVGKEADTEFWGGSFVCDAFGRTLARADNQEGVTIQEVNLGHGKEVLSGWGFMRNRRPDSYAPISD